MVSLGVVGARLQKLAQKYGSIRAVFAQGVVSSAALFIVAVPSLFHINGHWEMVAASYVIGLFGYIPLVAFTRGVKVGKIGIVAPVAGTAPMVAVLLAYFFLKVPLSPAQWVAVLLIVAAN